MIVMNSNCFIEIYRIGGQIKSVGRTFDALLSTFRKIKNHWPLSWRGVREVFGLIIQYCTYLSLFFFGAYIGSSCAHIEGYSQIYHCIVFAPIFFIV